MRLQCWPNRLFPTCLVLIVLASVLGVASSVSAQPPSPSITFVFPAGGQRGQTVEATVSGTNLQGATEVRITGGGVTAKVEQVVNVTTVRISVAIAADAVLGERDIRLVTPNGVSTRFRFFIGELAEINEKEPNSLTSQTQLLESLPILVNGQVMPADRDIFRFAAKAGETVVCQVDARTVLPYIADAVPGWLDACLTLYDGGGKQLQFVNDFRFHPDPVLAYAVPKDGEYSIEVRDLIYRGRADFTYRLTVGVLPYITHIFPLGGQRNSTAKVESHGVNLAANSLEFPIPGDHPPLRFVRLSHNGRNSNVLPFAVGDDKEAQETEPNDSIEQTNRIEVPVTINGRIQAHGDADHFSFGAKKGQRLVLEVQARRVGSTLDSLLTLFNAKGQELREVDDTDMGDPLLTQHADGRLDYTFPEDGDYVLRIKDIQGKGADDCAYRIHVAPPRPDLALRAIPDNARVAKNDSVVVTVKALRKDGFNGKIKLAVQNLPEGFVASDAVIQGNQSQARLTITAPPNAASALLSPTIVGTSTIGTEAAVRKAVGAEDIMQAFSLRHDVPTKELLLAVIATADFTVSSNIASTEVREVRQESELQVVVAASREGIKAAVVQVEAEKKATDEALVKTKADLAKAKTDYAAAEAAAKAAEAAAPKAKTAAANAATAQANAQKAAATKRQQANDAKKKVDELVQKPQTPAEARLAAATKAFQTADKAATDAETAAATAKTAADAARAAQAAAEKAAPEKRKLANDAKAQQDKLVNDEKAANAKVAEVNKRLAATKAKAASEIKLTADALPKGVTLKPAGIPVDKSEVTVTLSLTNQAAVGLRQNIIITGTIGAGNDIVTHVAPAIPIKVIESVKTLAATAAAKRKLANDAKKKVDDLVQKQQKPAEAKLAAAVKAVTDATTAKAAADKVLADVKAATVKAQQAYDAAEKVAKDAEAAGKTISADAGKSAEEKKKAAEDAAAKRKAADAAKTVLTEAQKKEPPAQTQIDAAAKKLAESEAQKKAAEQALANIKSQVTAATTAYQAADKVAKEAEAIAAAAAAEKK